MLVGIPYLDVVEIGMLLFAKWLCWHVCEGDL